MKTKLTLTILTLCLLAFVSCGDNDNEAKPTKMQRLSGHVEKGPFVQGSEVTLHELTADFSQTGKSFRTQTEGALGAFSLNTAMELISQYAELSVTGFYYHEVRGELSAAPITLRALADVSGRTTMNVNLLTHLTRSRTLRLIAEGKPFNEAKAQAGRELLRVFAIEGELPSPENVSIAEGSRESGILLAISTILLHDRSDAEFTEMLAAFSTEFAESGCILSTAMREAIRRGQAEAHPSEVIGKMQAFYAERGMTLQVQDFSPYIDFNGNGVIDEQDKEENLDNYPDETIVEESFLKDEKDIKVFVNDIYRKLSYFSADQLTLQAVRLGLTDDKIHEVQLDRSTDPYISRAWVDGYSVINTLNFGIDMLEHRNFVFYKAPYLGMLYALRAYTYYQLAILWGNIPYYTEPINTDNYDIIRQRSAEEVLRECLGDLDIAIPLLSEAEEEHSGWENILQVSHNYVLNSHAARALYTEIRLALGIDTSLPSNLAYDFYIHVTERSNAVNNWYQEWFLEHVGSDMKVYNGTIYGLLHNESEQRSHADAEALKKLALSWKNLAAEGAVGAWAALKRLGQAQALTGCKDHELLLPIPAEDLRINTHWKQNPGY